MVALPIQWAAGIEVSNHRGRCSIWFDFNNDGRLDMFVKNYADANVLYANNGDGTFTQVPDAGGLADAAAGTGLGSILATADYDNDGFVDLAITGDGDTQRLYRNLGNVLRRRDVRCRNQSRAQGKGIAWGDYDNDGMLDLFGAQATRPGRRISTAITATGPSPTSRRQRHKSRGITGRPSGVTTITTAF
jgi:hypothetical protein